MARKTERPVFFAIRVAIGVLFVVLLARSGLLDWSRLRGLADPRTGGLALLLLALTVVVVSWRLCVLLRPLGMHLPLTASIRLSVLGMLFNAWLPGGAGGDLMRIYYATAENQGRRTEITAIMAFDRGIGMFALFAWPVLAAPFFIGVITASPAVAMLIVLMAAGALGVGFVLAALLSSRVSASRFAQRLFAQPRVGGYAARIAEALRAYRGRPGALAAGVGLALLGHTLFVLAALVLAAAVAPDGMSWSMALLLPLGFMANALPVTPGGLGVGEAALEGLFRMGGFTGGAELMLSWRILSLLVASAGLPVYLRGRRAFVRHAGGVPPAGTPPPSDPVTLSRHGAAG